MKNSLRTQASVAIALFGASIVSAQTPAPKTAPTAAPAAQAAPGAPKPPDRKPGELKKYDEVVTKEATTQEGVFKVHRIEDRILWEIPAAMLNRDFVWQTEIAELPSGLGYPGTNAGDRQVRFTRRGNKIFLRGVDYSVQAIGDEGTKAGVQANNVQPVLASFDVQTEGADKAAVIDVTQLFTSDPQDFGVRARLGAAGVDPSRSYIDRVKAFPKNIETRSFLTFVMAPGGRGGAFRSSAASTTIHYSLALLPEKPMMGRLKDSRIGYFTTDFDVYGDSENRTKEVRFIDRYRLEKKDPSAALSEPVKPIVYYVSREVPVKWRSYVKKAIEDWQPAFEQAGFKNAIIAKDAPTLAEDPTWDPEDSRYSVIRWAPSRTFNAMGPHIADPRSGEILSAHVIVWNDIVKIGDELMFPQTAAIDPRFQKTPLSDEVVGELLRYVVAHEVGHTLGLEHNFKASTAYTIAQLRDPEFTKDHGVAASIMSYSRANYVAQPGDGVTHTWGMIGPYDKFAIEYGYKPLPYASSPDAEKSTLDTLLAKQVTNPWLRFGNYEYIGIDPTTQTELISNDPVEAGRLGLKNLDTIAEKYLLKMGSKFGEDYSRLDELHGSLLNQRFTELLHIAALVGGVVETDYHAGRGGEVFKPVSAAKQAAAVNFLTTVGMQTPKALFNPAVINRVTPVGLVDRVTSRQTVLLSALLSEVRLKRLVDNEAANGKNAYTIGQLVDAITSGVWTELGAAKPTVDIYRRTLQRAYLTTLDTKINGSTATKTDLKPLAKDELRTLAHQIDKALPKVTDRMTALHLRESRQDIEKILNGKFSTPAAASGLGGFLFGFTDKDAAGCWAPWATIRKAIEAAEKSN